MNIKNLKINPSFKKKFKKIVLKKIPMTFTIIAMSTTMLLTGCFSPKTNVKVDNLNEKTTSTYNQTINTYSNNKYDNPYKNIDKSNYNNSTIKISKESYNDFIRYIDDIDTEYEFEKYYHIDEAFSKYDSIKDKKVTNHTYKINTITKESIYNQVKINNKKYLTEKEKKYVSKFYDEFSDSELKKICNIISEEINMYIKDGKVKDIDELKCILGDLKIVVKSTMSNAYVTDDNCMVISPSMIEAFKLKAKNKNQDMLKDVVAHETIHLIQKSCVDAIKYRNSVGNSIKFEDLKINPLFWNWFFEASAEKCSMKYTKDSATTYEYFINYMDSLSLSTLLYKDNYSSQILDSSLIKDFDPLFKAVKAETDKQKKEIIKMMFTIDILEEKNKGFYDEFNPNISDDELILMNRKLKNSICETMSKSFYKSLAELVRYNNLQLNDIFYLITVFESDLNSHLGYTIEEKYKDVKPFMEKYINIQNEFFYLLSNSQKYSQDEIEEKFNAYGIITKDGKKNYNLNFLNSDKVNFIDELLSRYDLNGIEQIRDALEKSKLKY